MSRSIKSLNVTKRDAVIHSRLEAGRRKEFPIKGLGFLAALDAKRAAKRNPDGHKKGTPNYKAGRNLEMRRHDYFLMIAQDRIGDGHRGSDGYKCPGSNKK